MSLDIRQAMWRNTLRLANKALSVLPAEVCQLTNLEVLDLRGNYLRELPPEIGRLSNLRTLDLADNQMTDLPATIGELTKLQTLHLANNHFRQLPPTIGTLTGLQTLYLSGNMLPALPAEIAGLTGLRTLYLSHNHLRDLPPEIGQLTNLDTLDVTANDLVALPPEIGQLTRLQRLDLNGNQVVAAGLPPELADLLVRGLQLRLEGTPLHHQLPELIERGAEPLAAYLRSLHDGVAQYEAKLLLVGEGTVGKTSLVSAILSEPFVPGRPTTHGIEIHPLSLRHPGRELDLTVRAWDFGGQEVYRITHQFFFSRRALYLLVWNARAGQEQNEVEGWLRRIRIRVGDDARILLVATHCDERRPEINLPYLKRTFPRLIAGHHAVDNSSGRGIPRLRRAIAREAAALPQMGQRLSPRWVAARDETLQRATTEAQIPYHEFVTICERNQVTGDEVTTLAGLLNDLGLVIYYGDDIGLRDLVVLNPEWLTKAIGYVLEDGPTKDAHGVLDHSRLRQIWQDRSDQATYPARLHPYFLRLMEKFDVSYRLEDDEHRSLVAQLVPHEQPGLPWTTDTPVLKGIRVLALTCRLSEPAPGLMAWLTVRHHRASTGRHWRQGVFLRHPIAKYASEALLTAQDDRELSIEVRAPSPDLFFNVLRDSVEDLITRRWPGIEYQLLVPCPTRAAKRAVCPGRFPLTGLIHYREEGGTTHTCLECVTTHDVHQLLTGFTVTPAPLEATLGLLEYKVSSLTQGMYRTERYAAEAAASMRQILKVVSTEVTDCPRLFTLTRPRPAGAHRTRAVYEQQFRLILWCEHPGQWHPWPAATYDLKQSRAWLLRVAPYAKVVLQTLRLVVPIAGAAAAVTLTEQQLKRAEHELSLAKTLVEKLPRQLPTAEPEIDPRESASRLTVAEGAALRALRVVLFEHDAARAFGGLRRVLAPGGDFLWVCPDHYPEYDPGLPVIPGTAL